MNKIILIVLLVTANTIFGQTPTVCHTPAESLSNLAEFNANINGLDHSDDLFRLRIYIHVLRREQEPKLGQSIEDVNRQLKYLYDDFDPLGIHFVWDGKIDYIENDEFYGDVQDNATEIFNTNSHSDGIDIYFFDVQQGASNGGFGRADNIGGSALLVGGAFKGRKDGGHQTPLSWYKIISHEMGHVLFLWHTHHGTFNEGTGNECPELVNGSNGTTCGDYVKDTPADPNIWLTNVNDCNIIEDPNDVIPDQDANGDTYQPDMGNMMSYTYPTCMVGFTNGQKSRMKNAIWYLPVLHNTLLESYTYIRPVDDCFVCSNFVSFNDFIVTSTENIGSLNIVSSNNIQVTVLSTTSNSMTLRVNNLLGWNEGERGYFSIVDSGLGGVLAHQSLWVGKPQAVPNNTLTGPTEVSAGQFVPHKIADGNLRLEGIETYDWRFPTPNKSYVFFGGLPPNNPTLWEYAYLSKYVPTVGSSVGNQTGDVSVRGVNPCGFGSTGFGNELCVENSDDPEGDVCNDFGLLPSIVYYPNPVTSFLTLDLSAQPLKNYKIAIYDEYQTLKYRGQSSNNLTNVDLSNLVNGSYYLRVYDDKNTLLLSETIVVVHH